MEHGTLHAHFYDRLTASKSPIHVPDVTLELHLAGETLAGFQRAGLRTLLFVPMLRKDELVGSFALGRVRVEHFTEKEIELLTDFAAQATIVLEIVHREQHGQLQTELAHANRVAALGQLSASIAHEVKQPIGAVSANAQAALRRQGNRRAGDVIGRISDLIKKAPPRKDRLEINGTIGELIEPTRGEAMKNGVSMQTDLAQDLPLIEVIGCNCNK